MLAEWVRNVRTQCKAQGVAFFFKQWGGVRKSSTGRELDGRTYDEYPDIVANAVPSPSSRASLLENLVYA